MEIKLSDDEVREILFKALEEKTNTLGKTLDEDDCYFTVTNSSGEVEDLETVEFAGVF